MWGTAPTSPTWDGWTTTQCCSPWAVLTRPWWSGRGSLWGPRRASWWTVRSRTPMRRRMEVSSVTHAYPAFLHLFLHHRKPTLLPCLSVVWGYDSDVAREKAIDYTTKIYAVSIREMEGTKPHQQMKEVSVEERYAVSRSACTCDAWWQETHWNQSVFSLPPKLLLKPVFIYVYAQSSPVHRLELREVSHSLQYEGRVGYSLQKLFMENELMRHEIWWDYQASLCLERLSGQPKPILNVNVMAHGGEHADLGGRRESRLLKSWRNTCGLWKIIFHSARVSALHPSTWCAFSYCVFTRPDLFRLVWSFQA